MVDKSPPAPARPSGRCPDRPWPGHLIANDSASGRRLASLRFAMVAVALAATWPSMARAAVPLGSAPATSKSRPDPVVTLEMASRDVRDMMDWVKASRDNHALPFMIIDKVAARVFVFDRNGDVRGSAPALLGLGRGDDSVSGIGKRKLATITPAERTTPAGRFEAALGHDLVQDILWIDYEAALSLHRVIVGNRKDQRAARLASTSPLDNRISFGCINVPAAFYDGVVVPTFTATVGIVYILPETRPLRAVFAIPER